MATINENDDDLSSEYDGYEPPSKEEIRRQVEVIMFMQALYGHKRLYIECLAEEPDAIPLMDPEGGEWQERVYVHRLNASPGHEWAQRRAFLEVVEWMRVNGWPEKRIAEYIRWINRKSRSQGRSPDSPSEKKE